MVCWSCQIDYCIKSWFAEFALPFSLSMCLGICLDNEVTDANGVYRKREIKQHLLMIILAKLGCDSRGSIWLVSVLKIAPSKA